MRSPSADQLLGSISMDQPPEVRALFHRLNNELGIILAHAELLETKASGEADRTRASQIVTSVLDAMNTAREIRRQMNGDRTPTESK
jgi:hypothetical protein